MAQVASHNPIDLLNHSRHVGFNHSHANTSSSAVLDENDSRIASITNGGALTPSKAQTQTLPDNLSWRTPLNANVSSVAHNHLTQQDDCPRCHIHAAFIAFSKHAQLCRDKVQEYTLAMNKRNTTIEFLSQVKQHLKAGGDEIDWTNDPEKQALVEKAKAHGVIFPEGELKWNKTQIEALVSNVDSTTNPLMSATDQDRMMQSWFLNKETESITQLTAMLQKNHELAIRIAQTLSK